MKHISAFQACFPVSWPLVQFLWIPLPRQPWTYGPAPVHFPDSPAPCRSSLRYDPTHVPTKPSYATPTKTSRPTIQAHWRFLCAAADVQGNRAKWPKQVTKLLTWFPRRGEARQNLLPSLMWPRTVSRACTHRHRQAGQHLRAHLAGFACFSLAAGQGALSSAQYARRAYWALRRAQAPIRRLLRGHTYMRTPKVYAYIYEHTCLYL